MLNFSNESQSNMTYLVYKLSKEDIIDEFVMGMVTNNNIPGILPLVLYEKDGETYIKYNVSSKVALKQFIMGVINRKKFIGIISSIVNTLLAADEYMLEHSDFLLDANNIFVTVGSGETAIMCVPLTNCKSNIDIKQFFKEILFGVQFDQNEDCSYIPKLMSYFNSTENFALKDFKQFLAELDEDKKEKVQAQQDRIEQDKTEKESNIYKEETVNIPMPQPEVAEVKPSKAMQIEIPGMSEPVDTTPNTKEKKGKWHLFGSKKEKNNAPSVSITIPKVEPDMAVSAHIGETTVLSEPVYGETTVLSDSNAGEKVPYLLRRKNGEKIYIRKSLFHIGKEPSYADYVISDNPTISRGHADIITKNMSFYIMDNNSKNHTYVNGTKVVSQEMCLIQAGDVIKLSNEEFEFGVE